MYAYSVITLVSRGHDMKKDTRERNLFIIIFLFVARIFAGFFVLFDGGT